MRWRLAFRMTFVGELGYELHIPAEFAVGVYEARSSSRAHHLGLRTAAISRSTRCAWNAATAIGAMM